MDYCFHTQPWAEGASTCSLTHMRSFSPRDTTCGQKSFSFIPERLILSQECWIDRFDVPANHRQYRCHTSPSLTLLTPTKQIGGFCGCFSYIYYWNPRYLRHVETFAPNPVPPEYRLEMALWASVPYAAVFFWFGWVAELLILRDAILFMHDATRWTSYPSISLWAPLSQGIIMGWAIIWLFVSDTLSSLVFMGRLKF